MIVEDDISLNNLILTKVTTIDEELKNIKLAPSFIKIDVEGYDFKAIKGSIETLKSGSVRLMKFENNKKELTHEIANFLNQIGWEVFALDSNGRPSKDQSLILLCDNLFASPVMQNMNY